MGCNYSSMYKPNDGLANLPYYWVILDPTSKEDKVKDTNLKNLPKFQIFYH